MSKKRHALCRIKSIILCQVYHLSRLEFDTNRRLFGLDISFWRSSFEFFYASLDVLLLCLWETGIRLEKLIPNIDIHTSRASSSSSIGSTFLTGMFTASSVNGNTSWHCRSDNSLFLCAGTSCASHSCFKNPVLGTPLGTEGKIPWACNISIYEQKVRCLWVDRRRRITNGEVYIERQIEDSMFLEDLWPSQVVSS